MNNEYFAKYLQGGGGINLRISLLAPVIIFGLRFAFFTHISGKKRTVSKDVR